MKLFMSPGACSLAPHIVMHELGMNFETVKVDLKTKQSSTGDYTRVNPKGSVPALQMDNGELMTEGPAIMQFLSDQKTDKQMMPKLGTLERYRAMEMFNYLTSEIHKTFGLLWGADRMMPTPESAEQLKTTAKGMLAQKFDYLANNPLKTNKFLLGDQFTACDAYLFTLLNWTHILKVDLTKWPALMGYMERIQSRPAVQAAMKGEGLIQ